MKTLQLILLSSTLLMLSCNKPKTFEYPEKKGEIVNILALDDNATVMQDVDYALLALLPSRKSIKVVITNLSTIPFDDPEPQWSFTAVTTDNWVESVYAEYKQTFSSKNKGKECYMKLKFTGGIIGNGSARIDIYENSEEITSSKIINW